MVHDIERALRRTPSISDLNTFEILKVHENRWTGKIPSFKSKLLSEICIQSNEFTGRIPTDFGNMKELVILRMSHNSWKGTIPSEFSKLEAFRKIQILHLHQNQLAGMAPSTKITPFAKKSYISDCGINSLVVCESCTMCCKPSVGNHECTHFIRRRLKSSLLMNYILIL